MTAAVLHPQQLNDAFVELVVAHTRNVEAHRVQRLNRRFVVEEPAESRRTTNEVAGRNSQAVLGVLTEVVELGSQEHTATGILPVHLPRSLIEDVAVVVIDAEELQIHDLSLDLAEPMHVTRAATNVARVDVPTTVEVVAAERAEEAVVSTVAFQSVIARFAAKDVVARAAQKIVVVCATEEAVVAVVAAQGVVPFATTEDVVAGPSTEDVIAATAE